MDKAKPLTISLTALAVLLALMSFLLFSKTQNLQKKNHSLLEESKKITESLEKAEAANRELVGKTEQEQKTLRESFAPLKKENESLKVAIKKAEVRASSAVEEKTYLEEMLINKTKEIDILKNSPAAVGAVGAVTTDAGELAQKIKQKDEEIAKLNEQNKILADKLSQLYKTTNDKIEEINVAKIALEETVSSARKKIEEEWNTVNLGTITVDKTAGGTGKDQRTTPKKDGRVLAINEEHGFIVIDLGKVDDLKQDGVLTVNRNGQSIATLSVLEIRDVMSACNVKDLQDGKKIQVNDSVSLRK